MFADPETAMATILKVTSCSFGKMRAKFFITAMAYGLCPPPTLPVKRWSANWRGCEV